MRRGCEAYSASAPREVRAGYAEYSSGGGLIESISLSSLACTSGNLATWYRNHVVVACVVSYAPLSSPITAEIPRACDTTCKVAALQQATCHVAHSLQCLFVSQRMRLPRLQQSQLDVGRMLACSTAH